MTFFVISSKFLYKFKIIYFYLGTYFAHSLTYVAKAWVFFSKTGADLKQWYFAINKDSFDYKKSHFRYLIPKEEKL